MRDGPSARGPSADPAWLAPARAARRGGLGSPPNAHDLLMPTPCAAFACTGFGLALQTCQANGFDGSLKDSANKLGIGHAAYGASPRLL